MRNTNTLLSIRGVGPYPVIGFFLLFIQFIILSTMLFDDGQQQFLLWSCNNFCFFMAIACFRKDMQMLMGVSYLGFVTQALWVADFTAGLVGLNVSGISDYIMSGPLTYKNEISIVLHMAVPLIILLFSFKVAPRIRSFYYSIPYMFMLYAGTFYLTKPDYDINCVFNACGVNLHVHYNILMWPVLATISIGLGYLVHNLLYYGWMYVRWHKIDTIAREN